MHRSLFPQSYAGRLTHRLQLEPCENSTLHVALLISKPGSYALDSWRVQSEVGELSSRFVEFDAHGWRARHRYEQGPPTGDHASVTVKAISES